MVADAVTSTHPDLWALLFSNVVVCGGLATCPGFQERLLKDLRPLVPDHIQVHTHCLYLCLWTLACVQWCMSGSVEFEFILKFRTELHTR